jgi:hypothetical protein
VGEGRQGVGRDSGVTGCDRSQDENAKYAEFMFRTGAMTAKPVSWKELFFPNVRSAPGS